MAITIGSHDAAGSDNGTTASVTINARANTALVVGVLCGDPGGGVPDAAPTLSDSKGNVFTPVGPELYNSAATGVGFYERAQMYVCLEAAGDAALTLTATKSGQYPSIFVVEVLADNPLELADVAYAEDTTIPYASGTVEPTADGTALIAFIADNRSSGYSYSVNSPFSITDQIDNLSSYYCGAAAAGIQSTAAPVAASFTPNFSNAYSGLVWTIALSETEGGGSTVVEVEGTAAGVATVSGDLEDASEPSSVSETSGTAAGVATVSGNAARIQAVVGTSAPNFAAAPTLGAYTLKWEFDGEGVDPHVSDPITTQNGSMLVVAVAAGNGNDNAPTDNKGNEFERVGDRINYTLWENYGVSMWVAKDIVGGAGHTVSVSKEFFPAGEISMHVIEFRNASVIRGDMTEVTSPNDNVSGEVETTGPAILFGHWWGDSAAGVATIDPRDGFTELDSAIAEANFIQTCAAYKVVSEANTYTLGWDESPTQGALLGLFAIEGGTGSSTNVISKTIVAVTATASGSATVAGESDFETVPVATGKFFALF